MFSTPEITYTYVINLFKILPKTGHPRWKPGLGLYVKNAVTGVMT